MKKSVNLMFIIILCMFCVFINTHNIEALSINVELEKMDSISIINETEELSVASMDTLDFWYSNLITAHYWSAFPSEVEVFKFSSMPSNFESAMRGALPKWNSALGCSLTYDDNVTDDEATYGIKVFAGRNYELENFSWFPREKLYESGKAGENFIDKTYSYQAYETMHNQTVTIYRIYCSNMFILDLEYAGLGSSYSNYLNVCTHELGHALGWNGHSTNSNDVMYSQPSTRTVLTSRDINHILQLY